MGTGRNNIAGVVRLQGMTGIRILAALTIAGMVMLMGVACWAGEANNGFTLGAGTLNPVATDTAGKSPGLVTAKYGFSLMKNITPYVGTGLAYAPPPENSVTDSSAKLKTGLAGQAGVSFNLGINSALVIDYKLLRFNNDPANNDRTTSPTSVGIGVNIKF